MNRQIKVIEEFSGYKEGTVCYNTGSSQGDRYGFDNQIMGGRALQSFYQRILLGESFPSKMILGRLDLEGVLAVSLFSSPQMILKDHCSSLFHSFEMVQSLGDVGLAHIPNDHRDLFLNLKNLVEQNYHSSDQKQKSLKQAIQMTTQYVLNGQLPPQAPIPSYEELVSKGEFIAYQSKEPIFYEIYGKGYLSGMWVHSKHPNRIAIFKKSQLVESPNLQKISQSLNNMESQDDVQGKWGEGEGNSSIVIQPPQKDGIFSTSLTIEEILKEILE